MSVHDSILRGLQDGLDYVKGDTTKGRTFIVDENIVMKYNKLQEDEKHIIETIIDKMLIANSKTIHN